MTAMNPPIPLPPRYGRLRLDGPLDDFHRALDLLLEPDRPTAHADLDVVWDDDRPVRDVKISGGQL